MKLRTAIRIMQTVEEPWRFKVLPIYKRRQYVKARSICRKKWRDHRVPLIPSDDQLEYRLMTTLSLLNQAFIDNGGPFTFDS